MTSNTPRPVGAWMLNEGDRVRLIDGRRGWVHHKRIADGAAIVDLDDGSADGVAVHEVARLYFSGEEDER